MKWCEHSIAPVALSDSQGERLKFPIEKYQQVERLGMQWLALLRKK